LKKVIRIILAIALVTVVCVSSLAVVNVVSGREREEDSEDCCCCESTPFFYVGRDWTTKGNWIEHGYGDCGYALPYGEPNEREIAIGSISAVEYGYLEANMSWRTPWSVEPPLPEQKFYPYQDYRGGYNILDYEVLGSEGPPRALVDVDSDEYRTTWYYNDSSIVIDVSVSGDYRVALYFLDWYMPKNIVNITVSSGGYSADTSLGEGVPGNYFKEAFASGVYALFDVHSEGKININVTKFSGDGAVISGVFLDTIGPVTGVSFVGFDRETMGNWRGVYGSDYYLLAGFNVPVVGCFDFQFTYDETNMAGFYEVSSGVQQCAADVSRYYGEYPFIGRYAAYEWADKTFGSYDTSRVLTYPTDKLYPDYPPPKNDKIYGQWDSGEFGLPLNYFIINLTIPSGRFILSIYAVDLEEIGRSELVEVWDKEMATLLDSQHIGANEINNGVYIQWLVSGPTALNIKVIADEGNLNSFIDGIFLNCLKFWCGKTIGFWKNNIRKALMCRTRGTQVSRQDILDALAEISENYGKGSMWNFEWLTFDGSELFNLMKAYNTLASRSWFERRWNWKANDMEYKARAQILALLLTISHFYNGDPGILTESVNTILNSYISGDYEAAKNLADFLNNLECICGS